MGTKWKQMVKIGSSRSVVGRDICAHGAMYPRMSPSSVCLATPDVRKQMWSKQSSFYWGESNVNWRAGKAVCWASYGTRYVVINTRRKRFIFYQVQDKWRSTLLPPPKVIKHWLFVDCFSSPCLNRFSYMSSFVMSCLAEILILSLLRLRNQPTVPGC